MPSPSDGSSSSRRQDVFIKTEEAQRGLAHSTANTSGAETISTQVSSRRLFKAWERYTTRNQSRTINEDLAFCFQETNTPLHHQSIFLKVLSTHHPTLSLDPKTLLQAPTNCVSPGHVPSVDPSPARSPIYSYPSPPSLSPSFMSRSPSRTPVAGPSNISSPSLQEVINTSMSDHSYTASYFSVTKLHRQLLAVSSRLTETTDMLRGVIAALLAMSTPLQAMELGLGHRSPPVTVCQRPVTPLTLELPARTVEDLDLLEAELTNPDVYRSLVTTLSRLGGSDSVVALRRMLSSVIHNDLAILMNWTGLCNKRPASNLLLMSAIRDAVEQNFSDLVVDELHAHMQRWFRNSRDRCGGRRKRLKRRATPNKDSTHIP
ncbi:hypothetical protein EG68_00116 [Paragonimus skrjabini miyazakii]|uniref:DUF4806 domain-containing protein n=1 Tax=Paragonimus skrjabini miyazakii TaxID=59628 RepID=A0A8S9Z555_9TREM|nr:hypothetical protein EG68_00116 [Paragonimus skrjabini miyazakii]